MFGQPDFTQDFSLGKPRGGTPLQRDGNRTVAAAYLLGDMQWPLLLDSSQNMRHARISALGGGSLDPRIWEPGRFGSSAFRAVAPAANGVKTDENYTPLTGGFTVACLFYPVSTVATFNPILGQWNEGTSKRSWQVIWFGSDQVLYCYTSSAGTGFHQYNTAAVTLATQKWYSIVVRFGGSGVATKINLNGSADIAADGGGNEANLGVFNTAQPIYIGHSLLFGSTQCGANARIETAIIDERLWTDAECLNYHLDPFGRWMRERRNFRGKTVAAPTATPRNQVVMI